MYILADFSNFLLICSVLQRLREFTTPYSKMKNKVIICALLLLNSGGELHSQSTIPKPKTREEIRAERKKMTIEQKIESILPVDVDLPSLKMNGEKADIQSVDDAKKFIKETIPGIGQKAKDKVKKTVDKGEEILTVFDGKKYKGIPISKQVIKQGTGARFRYTEFYTLKTFQSPNPYIRELHWMDTKTKKVVTGIGRDRNRYVLLHGPYQEYIGEVLIQEANYYLGAKDGRWLTHDRNNILLDKEYWQEGFLEESEKTFYDSSKTKLKEVIPIKFGEKNGKYYAYHPEGTLWMEGEMQDGLRVGKWIEYYPQGNKRKRELEYTKEGNEEKVLREYDEKGKIVFELK